MREQIRNEKLGMEYLRLVDETGLTVLLYPDSRYRSVYMGAALACIFCPTVSRYLCFALSSRWEMLSPTQLSFK